MANPQFGSLRSYFWGFLTLIAAVVLSATSQTQAAQVFATDLVVQGSACIGIDCASNPSFGFDTIRLKENNLRIKFEDTSTSASFPSNDWQLTANDSSNGGDNKFSIDDISGSKTPFTIEAGARTDALYVDSQGDVGIGTDNPVVELHAVSGDSPTLRLEQNGSSGFTPQTWDLAGNETNFFIRDVTNGSKLPFRIRPSAPSNSIHIAADGKVGVGTDSPSEALHIRDTAGTNGFILVEDTQNGAGFDFIADSSGANHQWRLLAGTNNTLSIREDGVSASERFKLETGGRLGIAGADPDGTRVFRVGTDATNGNGAYLSPAGVWTDASSRANKEQIAALSADAAKEALESLEPVTYYGRGSETKDQVVGFIAEDVPELVAVPERTGVAAIEVTAVVTKVVKEQQRTIERQQKMIEQLNRRLEQLESRQ